MNVVKFKVFTTIICLLYLPSIIQSDPAASPKSGPGISACTFQGYNPELCSAPEVSIDILPSVCTSFFWDGLTVDLERKVQCSYTKVEEDNLNVLLKSNKPVYAYYGYSLQQDWVQILDCQGKDPIACHAEEMKNLKDYLTQHPGIAALVLTSLEFNEKSQASPGFTENLIAYIGALRATLPDVKIGMEMFGYSLITYFENPLIDWLDFKFVDPVMDFYVINVYIFNECTPELTASGTCPLTGNAPYTLTKVKDILAKTCVPTDKMYYNFRLSATAADNQLSDCDFLTYQKICTKPKAESEKLCADTQQTLFEKGQFVKTNAAGFIGSTIDHTDPFNDCHCDRPFAAFYAILDGFSGNPAPKDCPLMNRK